MSKQQNQTNSKKISSNKEIESKGRSSFIDKIILLLYLGVGFVKPMKAFDVSVTQWLYISILNLVVFGFFFLNKKKYPFVINNRVMKFVFGGALLFLVFSLLSITQSISVSESIVFTLILLSTLIAFFNLYIILKDNSKEYFNFIVYIIAFFLFMEAIEVINHFAIKNGSKPRSNDLFKGLNPTYGNRNILAASIVIKTSVCFYLILVSGDLKKYFIGLILFFLGTLSVLLIGARTAIYALPIVTFVLVSGFLVINTGETIVLKFKKHIIPVSIVCFLSVISSLSINKIHQTKLNTFNDLVFTKNKEYLYKEPVKTNKSKVVSKSASLASDSGRKTFWVSAIDGFKTSPLLGVGIGNWKMIEKPDLIKSRKTNSFFYPTRTHNDFLQVLCDIGIFGFLLFISFFGLIYFLLIKTVLLKKYTKEKRLASLVLLCGFIAYTLDCLINFPNERPPIQILGFFVIVLSLIFTIKESEKFLIPEYFKYILMVVLISVIYFNRDYFISSKHALVLRANLLGKNKMTSKYKIKYDDYNEALDGFPTINPLGKPYDIEKAYLAYSEGKYDAALMHLDKAIAISPNTQEHLSFKASIFYSNKEYKNIDSAFYYSKKAFTARPSLINQYNLLKYCYEAKKDTINIINTINTHIKNCPSNEKPWIDKINFYLKYKKDVARAIEVRDSAKMKYPDKKNIQGLKDFTQKRVSNTVASNIRIRQLSDLGNKLFAQGKYKQANIEYAKALQVDKGNMNVLINMALVDLRQEKYNKAIEKLTTVINSGKIKTGKPEYNRGFSYIKIGKKSLASKDFIKSRDKGYPLAKKLSKNYFNY